MGQCESTGLWNAALDSAMAAKMAYGLIGLVCIWMGYRLFVLGVYRGGAEVRAGNNDKSGGLSFSISRGGPGLDFALFGACVVLYSIANKSNTSLEGGGLLQTDAVVEISKHSQMAIKKE
ncbi:hypothetical protein [Pseudoalteromonas xiamenensis]